MPGETSFEFHFGQPSSRPEPRRAEGDALRILVMGDFSGRAVRGQSAETAKRRPIPVDVDNFDHILSKLAPGLDLSGGDPALLHTLLEFKELEDFHPDRLYPKIEPIQALRHLRGRLLDPATFEEAAAELKREAGSARPATAESADTASNKGPEDSSATFARLLGAAPSSSPPEVSGQGSDKSDPLARFIQGIVEPDLAPAADADQQRMLVATVDDSIARQMRAVLHDSGFQALESAWRGLHWLIANLETGEELKIYLLDVSRPELAADILGAGTDLRQSELYRTLVEAGPGTPGGAPWSLVVGNYSFAPTDDDLNLLAALGTLAAGAGGAFLGAADPAVLGLADLADAPEPGDLKLDDPEAAARWQALRRSPAAASIGLALPRVLLRLPYGERGDPIESFEFEELSGPGEHEGYLWGNPAFACALLVGLAFQESGWAMAPGDLLEIEDLPAYSFKLEGEACLKPCAEVALSHRAAEAILERGVMPLLSHPSRNMVRLARFQSLRDPAAALAGPWA